MERSTSWGMLRPMSEEMYLLNQAMLYISRAIYPIYKNVDVSGVPLKCTTPVPFVEDTVSGYT